MLAYVLGVVLFVLCFWFSVSLHEAGHMWTARAFGMRVRRYFVGFGPTIFSFRRGHTQYGLKAIPLGGFCEIAGMTSLDEVTPEEAPRAMWRFPVWKRTVVMAAGSVMQFGLGFLILYLMATTMGLPNVAGVPQVESVASCVRDATTPEEVSDPRCEAGDAAPAREAGLRPGDRIVSVDGVTTLTYAEVMVAVQGSSGPTRLEVERDGGTRPVTVDVRQVERPVAVPGEAEPEIRTTGTIGVSFVRQFEYGPVAAIPGTAAFTGDMVVQTFHRLVEFPQRIPAVVSAIFGDERDPETPISVVGASRIGGG
ncbi:M50 family metallopeptidase, partial [Actinoalloteichus caeruleus]|uniref:M50 family metallopeptidase n=1 Tax=Actinoalloteichus cyanogriseus TaxID=2893586 RepID=UPI0009DD4B90